MKLNHKIKYKQMYENKQYLTIHLNSLYSSEFYLVINEVPSRECKTCVNN